MHLKSEKDLTLTAIEGELLLIEMPSGLDLDTLADAFVAFAEDLFEVSTGNLPKEVFSWSEVSKAQFDQKCLTRLQTCDTALLHAVWTQGLIGIIAPSGRLTPALRKDLFDCLRASQEGPASRDARWQIVQLDAVPNADRGQPILATPEQLAYLDLCAPQEAGDHPTVAMAPIFLNAPNVQAFEAAFEILQERHEILHMSFARTAERTYLRVHDEADPPFSTKRVNRSLQTIEQAAAQAQAKLCDRLSTDGPLWAAVLVQKGPKAALVCVFSETIADPQTAVLLRSEVRQLYDWFKDGPNHEPPGAGPKPQFLDFAAVERRSVQALAWWKSLNITRMRTPQDIIAEYAPVVVLDQDITAKIYARFEGQEEAIQALFFHSFLKCLNEIDRSEPRWAVARTYDQRPRQEPQMLGQFSLDVPVWLGDLPEHSSTEILGKRLNSTLRMGAVSKQDLAQALPNHLPHRMPYLFDWRPQAPGAEQGLLPQDVTLRCWREGRALKARWAIRRDHPASLTQDAVQGMFLKTLSKLSDVSACGTDLRFS